eukprot:206614_1
MTLINVYNANQCLISFSSLNDAGVYRLYRSLASGDHDVCGVLYVFIISRSIIHTIQRFLCVHFIVTLFCAVCPMETWLIPSVSSSFHHVILNSVSVACA